MHQHADTWLVLKTFSATLGVLWIWACYIPTDPRVMPHLLILSRLSPCWLCWCRILIWSAQGALSKGYVFTVGSTAISWRSTKQTLVVTSSNYAEFLALHEAHWECFWLKAIVGHIRSSCDLYLVVDIPTTIYEDNAACIEQLKKGYIKGDNTKHIMLKFFFSHQWQEHQKIEVTQIHSRDNLADLFTKSPLKATFQKLFQEIGMCKLSEL